jgi:uncharacterized protein
LVEIHLREDSRRRLSSFLATGHAGWDEEGHDIVCAAVSAILQSAVVGLDEVARVTVRSTRRKGRLDVRWPAAARDDPAARAIVETAARSLEYIARQHPANVVVIRERDDG